MVLAYVTGMVVAFLLNRWFVFENARDRASERAWHFVVVNLLAVLQTLLVVLAGTWVLVRLGLPTATAEAAAAAHRRGGHRAGVLQLRDAQAVDIFPVEQHLNPLN